MDIPEGIFKSYDIRGIYSSQINEENIIPIVRAIYKFFQQSAGKENLKIVVGRDMRVSSPILFEAATKTLVDIGAQVIDVGLVSTPTFYFSVLNYSYDCGFQISASHNSKEYNGLKIVRKTEKGILKIGKPTGMEDIKKMALEGVEFADVEKKGSITEHKGVLADEINNAIKIAGNPEIKPFKVVADPANAMGALYIEELFKTIPGQLIKMNFELDGTFPVHQPDPLQFDTLKDLQKKVVEEGADIGLAPDGDADRLYFIDEKGGIVLPSSMTSLVAKELLHQQKGGKVLVDLKYVFTPKKTVEEFGGELVVSKTGHAYITEAMHKNEALFAGEASGHFYWSATGGAESPMPVILLILSVMTREGKPLSVLAHEVRSSHESGEMNFKVQNAQEIMERLKEHYHDGQFSDLDGIAIDYPNWRFSLRSSNTEPLLRLNIEAFKEQDVEDKKKEVLEVIKQHAIFEIENESH